MTPATDVPRAYDGANVLVTGGLGFVGSSLARALVDAGARVTILDNLDPSFGGNKFNVHDIESRVTVRVADVREARVTDELIPGQDYVFHLAAQTSHVGSMEDPRTDLEINAAASMQIAEACRRRNPGARVVYTSTRQLYGRPDALPVNEDHPIRPPDVNAINKLAGEHYHLLYDRVYGVRACVLRLTNTFGPRMRVKDGRQTFIGLWVRQLLEGKPIRIFGDGRQRRDFTYIDDCVDALLRAGALDAASGRIYNVGAGEHASLTEIATAMTGLGYGGSFEYSEFPPERASIDIGDYYADDSRLRRELGWAPRVPLDEGLRRTVAYYKAHLDCYL